MPYLMNKVEDLLKYTKSALQKVGIKSYSLDGDLLVASSCGLNTREELLLSLNEKVEISVLNKCEELISRRIKGEPIAYILRKAEFWDFNLDVTRDVLIPRSDSETIIEVVLKTLNKRDITNKELRVLDLGTGSGCLIIALLKIFSNARGVATDISNAALQVAKTNAKKFKLDNRISFLKSNWFQSLSQDQKYDIIVCNPPYIRLSEWNRLEKDVKNYEPKMSLTDNADGLTHYRAITKKLHDYLKESGIALFEIGDNQKEQVSEIFVKKGFETRSFYDLSGMHRVILATAK